MNKSFVKFIGVTILNVVLGITYTELEELGFLCSKPRGFCDGNSDTSLENCFCDKMCAEYGDCCLDATHYNLQEHTLPERYKCVDLGHEAVHMKDRCMAGWEDPEMTRLCEAGSLENISSSRDPLDHLPVTSNITSRTYTNYYCAICNNDSTSLAFWETQVDCSKYHIFTNLTKEYIESNLQFKNDSWGIFLPNNGVETFLSCPIRLSVYETARRCYPSTKSCNDSWSDASVETLCHSYTAVRYSFGSAYRNPHCALCNFVSSEDITCFDFSILSYEHDVVSFRHGFGKPVSFAILVDFISPSGNTSVGTKPECNPVEKDSQLFKCTTVSDYRVSPNLERPYNETSEDKFSQAMGWVSLVGLGLSCVCLLLHLVAFLLVPHLKNLPGISMASLCLSLLTAYIIFIVSSFITPNTTECYILGAAMYYSFLASFCWMNVMAFDVWQTLRQARRAGGRQRAKLLAYSTYGWLLPALALVVMVTIDQVAPESFPSEFRPSLGQHLCWFGKRKALVVFFGVPLFTVMILNVVFFLATAYTMAGSREPGLRVSSNSHQRKQFWMYLRLAVLMGLTWVSGIVAGYLQLEVTWYIFVLLNSLQGVFIFLAFTCRSKVWHTLTELGQKCLQSEEYDMSESVTGATSPNSNNSQLSVHTESTHL